MTEEDLVVFDILMRPAPELSTEERTEVKKVKRALLTRLKQLLVLNWRQPPSGCAAWLTRPSRNSFGLSWMRK